jgi:ribose-phosphate pyrophosphokinase
MQLISCKSNVALATEISELLKIPLSPVEDKYFADGEIYVRIKNKVRGDDIYIIQSIVAPANDRLMELLIMIDALRRASAGRINLICPYLCYSRQDRKAASREPITAKLVANLITKAGADRMLTVDLHAEQIQGFYDIPLDHFLGYPLFAKYLRKKKLLGNAVIVSPDMGGVKRANKMADLLGLKLVVIDKIRKAHNESEVIHVVGEVDGKRCIILDDIIDTGGSICSAAEALKKKGAKEVIVCATHGLLSGNAKEKFDCGCVDLLLLTNSVPIPNERLPDKAVVISLAPLIAKIIKRIHLDRSLGELFTWEDKKMAL